MPDTSILFIGLSSVGDAVMTSPVLQSLHNAYPAACFDIVADRRSVNLYKNFPCLRNLYIKDKDKLMRGVPGLLLSLWNNRYDAIVDLRTDGLAYLLRGKKRYTKWRSKSYGPHAVEQLLGVIASLHGDKPVPGTCVWLSKQDEAYAEQKTAGFENSDNLLAISTGNPAQPEKTLPTSKFIQLLNRHEHDFSGVIFLGGAAEKQKTRAVINNVNLKYIDTVGNALLEAAALLKRSALYIGPDSGLGHIAAAVKTPTISFFGRHSPERFKPWGNRAICLRGNDDARNIPVDKVSKAITESLS